MKKPLLYKCNDKLSLMTLKNKTDLIMQRMKNQNYSFESHGFLRIKDVKSTTNTSNCLVLEYFVESSRFADERYYLLLDKFYLNEIDLILSF